MLEELLAERSIFDQREHLHTLVLRSVETADELLAVLASLALVYRPRLLLMTFGGHGSKPDSNQPSSLLEFRGAGANLSAARLAPLLCACGAPTTFVLLDCCYSTAVFRNLAFPGLIVVPACGEDERTFSDFTAENFVPVLRGTCNLNSSCAAFRQACLAHNGRVPVMFLVDHLRQHLPVCVGFPKRRRSEEEEEEEGSEG